MTRPAFVLFLLVGFLSACTSAIRCNPPLPDDDPLTFRWGCPAITPTNVAPARDISIANQANGALGVLFTNGRVNLQPPSTLLTGTWTSSLLFPVETNASRPVQLRCTYSGNVQKTANASANALVHIGDASGVVSFPSGAAADEDVRRELTVTVPAGVTAFPVSVSIAASRTSTADTAFLEIDDVDCALVRP